MEFVDKLVGLYEKAVNPVVVIDIFAGRFGSVDASLLLVFSPRASR